MGAVVNEKVKDLKEKLDVLLKLYRQKHDELELAEEEWDIGEIQVALEDYTKEIKILKEKVREIEQV